MGRFYFDILDNGRSIVDTDGSELPGLESARDEAVSTLGQIARDHLPSDDHWQFSIAVMDDAHRMLLKASIELRVERYI